MQGQRRSISSAPPEYVNPEPGTGWRDPGAGGVGQRIVMEDLEALRMVEITKTYEATIALDKASFSVRSGEVHGLLGENGAGKSTTIKLLSGLIRPDSGSVRIFNQEALLRNPKQAHKMGVQTVFQEISLVRDLTVLENLLLPKAPIFATGQINRRLGRRLVAEHFARIGLYGIELAEVVRNLDLSQRQKVEIARALFRSPKILLLDEPTSALSGRDIDWLHGIVANCKAEGITVIFISHRIGEVRLFCDRLTVLRNGKDVGTSDVAAISDQEVIRLIIGRSLAATFPPKPAHKPDSREGVPAAFSVSRLTTAGKLRGASFDLWPGEILGIAALQGMGQRELFNVCFGMTFLRSGTIRIDGQAVTLSSPRAAIRANVGISFVPEDRKTESLFLKLDGKFNVTLPVITRYSRFGFVDRKLETVAAAKILDEVEVQPKALSTRAGALSGGNQQKLAIAKWLLAGSRIFLMFDPTRGVDVGTKHQLYLLMRSLASTGASILFYSTEIAELVNLCDRVLVMYGGRIVTEFRDDAIDEKQIMSAARGGGSWMNLSLDE
jgi:ribose transport system ATP-binding protein